MLSNVQDEVFRQADMIESGHRIGRYISLFTYIPFEVVGVRAVLLPAFFELSCPYIKPDSKGFL